MEVMTISWSGKVFTVEKESRKANHKSILSIQQVNNSEKIFNGNKTNKIFRVHNPHSIADKLRFIAWLFPLSFQIFSRETFSNKHI